VLVEADIVRQTAYADLPEVDFDDHVCRIHATLHKMVDWVGVTLTSTRNQSSDRIAFDSRFWICG
jgi:hypothetical protein